MLLKRRDGYFYMCYLTPSSPGGSLRPVLQMRRGLSSQALVSPGSLELQMEVY